ncbi:Uncharacterized protein TCM_045261 [Theobroma cacao]|uniref:Uncharacterized protein n=1 Tax=Theobroma cacao TaxID=3641 RepID=A0A061FSJ8_THECC|nr:Uncharacterized protein TCM_045261 [Theobroma cacao]
MDTSKSSCVRSFNIGVVVSVQGCYMGVGVAIRDYQRRSDSYAGRNQMAKNPFVALQLIYKAKLKIQFGTIKDLVGILANLFQHATFINID